jgi:uncharacterized protein (DUF2062 family)
MNLKTHVIEAVARLRRLQASPHEVALGMSIGIFFGFSPLFGLKTILALAIAWALKANKIAAVITVTLHDLLLPLFPLFLRWEYDLGYWTLNSPHEFPPKIPLHHLNLGTWLEWSNLFTVGRPLLVGAILFGFPIACVTYAFVLTAIHQSSLNKNTVSG